MSADQSLAVATNAMCVIAFCKPDPVTAVFIAEQISLNPVVIRRALGKLVAAGLVHSTQGAAGGYVLALPAERVTLQEIYAALSSKGVFERNNALPRSNCADGKEIGIVLNDVFTQAEAAFAEVLQNTTLANVLERTKTS